MDEPTKEAHVPTDAPSRPRLLTTDEAADALRTTDWTIRSLVASGRLRGFRLSKRRPYRIVADDVERLLRGEAEPS
jgi:excisionase family DNA binding protein